MSQEDADLWQREQLILIRKAAAETDRFSAEQRVLIAEAQREARLLRHASGLDAASRYAVPLGTAALLTVMISAAAGFAVGFTLVRVVAAHCTGAAPA